MSRRKSVRLAGLAGVAALVVCGLPAAVAAGLAPSQAAAAVTLSRHAPRAAPGLVMAPITGRPLLGTGRTGVPVDAAPTPLPGRKQQIQVLAGVLANMQANYAKYARYTPGPQDIFGYGIGKLWMKGIDGAGTTMAVIEGWNDPAIAQTVARFDKVFGLPNPQITTIYPAGPLPPVCPPGMVALGSYGSCSAWQGELTLDVISAHLIAPYAKILISATPADTQITAGPAQQVAPPEMMKALEVISREHLANVISISDGTGEGTYSNGRPEILAQNPGELAAAAAGIPVLNASGDCGIVQNLAVANGQCEDVSTGPMTATWDDSPWVTAVGGSVPNVSPVNGARLGPDPLWHVPPPYAQFSEGAGFSAIYPRPSYQNGVASITGSPMRSVPDLTMDAQDGTSEAAPLLNGVLALATQLNDGHNVGPINPVLYRVLGPAGASAGIADVVSGNDSAETPGGKVLVPGFTAGPGFDVASGWGTVYAPRFVPSLVAATRSTPLTVMARLDARTRLMSLERAVHLSPRHARPGMTIQLRGTGFLPGYPVQLMVDGRLAATLHADSAGDVTATINPASLGLRRGYHQVSLTSMLITERSAFVTS